MFTSFLQESVGNWLWSYSIVAEVQPVGVLEPDVLILGPFTQPTKHFEKPSIFFTAIYTTRKTHSKNCLCLLIVVLRWVVRMRNSLLLGMRAHGSKESLVTKTRIIHQCFESEHLHCQKSVKFMMAFQKTEPHEKVCFFFLGGGGGG